MFRREEASRLNEKMSGVMRAAFAIALLAIAGIASTAGGAQSTQKGAVPPAKLTPQQLAEIARAHLLTHGKLSPKIRNPNADSATAGIIATLRSQKQVADMELQELSTMAPVTTQGSGPQASPAASPAAAAASSGKAGGKPGANAAISMNVPQPRSNTASSAVLQHPAGAEHPQMAIPCRQPNITTVNGKASGIIFTPEAEWNLYTIKGCGFGNAVGNIYLKGPFNGGRIPLQIRPNKDPKHPTFVWRDTAIVASLDPRLTGEVDQDSVTLVIEPASGPPMEKPGFKFFAARELVLLDSIPDSVSFMSPQPREFRLARLKPRDHKTGDTEVAVEVLRYEFVDLDQTDTDPLVLHHPYSPGQDSFVFSGLNAGFIVAEAQIKFYTYPPDPKYVPFYTSADPQIWLGGWEAKVYWGIADFLVCEPCGSLKLETSMYGLNFWVSGPRGVNPWRTVVGIPVAPHKPNPAVKPHP